MTFPVFLPVASRRVWWWFWKPRPRPLIIAGCGFWLAVFYLWFVPKMVACWLVLLLVVLAQVVSLLAGLAWWPVAAIRRRMMA